MNDNDYIHIEAWMGKRLGLRGNLLSCFALIYGYSRNGNGVYKAGVKYICDMLFCSEPTALSCLDKLIELELIRKSKVVINGHERCIYYVCVKYEDGELVCFDKIVGQTKETLVGQTKETLVGQTKETLVYNKNIEINKKGSNNKRLSNDNPKDELFEKFWIDYGREGSKAKAKKEWDRLKDEDKKTVMSTLSSYLIYCKRIKRRKKDACSYLHQEYYAQDWNIIPDYYQIQPTDNARLVKFKQYMVDRFKDLIYHRNPLTFEQAEELINDLGLTEFESVMDKLAQRDIHQYFSIFKGVETVLNEEQ